MSLSITRQNMKLKIREQPQQQSNKAICFSSLQVHRARILMVNTGLLHRTKVPNRIINMEPPKGYKTKNEIKNKGSKTEAVDKTLLTN